jgi:hypothetical protein
VRQRKVAWGDLGPIVARHLEHTSSARARSAGANRENTSASPPPAPAPRRSHPRASAVQAHPFVCWDLFPSWAGYLSGRVWFTEVK